METTSDTESRTWGSSFAKMPICNRRSHSSNYHESDEEQPKLKTYVQEHTIETKTYTNVHTKKHLIHDNNHKQLQAVEYLALVTG